MKCKVTKKKWKYIMYSEKESRNKSIYILNTILYRRYNNNKWNLWGNMNMFLDKIVCFYVINTECQKINMK